LDRRNPKGGLREHCWGTVGKPDSNRKKTQGRIERVQKEVSSKSKSLLFGREGRPFARINWGVKSGKMFLGKPFKLSR